LDIAWPLRSDSPVLDAFGVSPVKLLNRDPFANRWALPTAACSTGPPISAIPGWS